MVDYNLIKSLGISDEEIEKQLSEAMGKEFSPEALGDMIQLGTPHQPGAVLKGRVVNIVGNDVIVEVGFKSEGAVDISEFEDPSSIEVGQEVEYFVTLPTVQTPGMIVRLHCLGHVVRRDADQDTLTASIERYEFVSHPQTSCHAA